MITQKPVSMQDIQETFADLLARFPTREVYVDIERGEIVVVARDREKGDVTIVSFT